MLPSQFWEIPTHRYTLRHYSVSGTLVPTDRPTELQIPTVNINADYKSGPLDFFFRATIISNYNAWIEFLICFQDQDLMFL